MFSAFASPTRKARFGSLFLVSAASVLASLTSACGTATFIVQQYDGSPLAEEQVAILRLNGDDPVRLDALDGEPLGYELHDRTSRVHIEMLPGEHELALAEGPEWPAKRRRFRAEAGKVYRPLLVRTDADGPVVPGITKWVVGIYEVDRSSDEIVREISQVTLVRQTPAPALAPPPSGAQPPSTVTQAPTPVTRAPTDAAALPATEAESSPEPSAVAPTPVVPSAAP